MGYIKEPAGVNFIVDSTPLTIEERKQISEIIAHFKATGRKLTWQSAGKQTSEKGIRKGRKKTN